MRIRAASVCPLHMILPRKQNIREQCVARAMIDYLMKPPVEFADVIRTHFTLRGDFILSTIDKWINESDKGASDKIHVSNLGRLKERLGNELAKLKTGT
jgi:hypothetical protein